jgi:hypothetical protein
VSRHVTEEISGLRYRKKSFELPYTIPHRHVGEYLGHKRLAGLVHNCVRCRNYELLCSPYAGLQSQSTAL